MSRPIPSLEFATPHALSPSQQQIIGRTTSPAAAAAAIPLLRDVLEPVVKGKTVALLGSAPQNAGIPNGCDLVASANGSHAAFGLSKVDLLFLNSWSLKPNRPVRRAVIEAVGRVRCDTLVCIDAADIASQALAGLDLGFRENFVLSDELRRVVLSWATGDDFTRLGADGKRVPVPSTGMCAALILRKLGAHVRLSGFSLEDGHALTEGAPHEHKDQDRQYAGFFAFDDQDGPQDVHFVEAAQRLPETLVAET